MENYKLILVILAGVVFSSFAIYCEIKYPRIASYSKVYYELKEEKNRRRLIFQGWVLALVLIIAMIGANWVYYTFSGLLTLVAFFPTIKNEKHFKWHLFGAISSILGLCIYLSFFLVLDEIFKYLSISLLVMLVQFCYSFTIARKDYFPPPLTKLLETTAFVYIILILYKIYG